MSAAGQPNAGDTTDADTLAAQHSGDTTDAETVAAERGRDTTDAEQAPFRTLIKMIERELELAGQGLIDEFQAAVEQTGAYIATLPSPAPQSAEPLVLRADALRGRVAIEAVRLRESIARSRTTLRRARKIARRYSGPRTGGISTSA